MVKIEKFKRYKGVEDSIFWKYYVVKGADDFSDDVFFRNGGYKLVDSLITLNAWRKQIKKLTLPVQALKYRYNRSFNDESLDKIKSTLKLMKKEVYKYRYNTSEISLCVDPALVKLIKKEKLSKEEFNQLVYSLIINDDGELTDFGKAHVIKRRSLEYQCKQIGVELKKKRFGYDGKGLIELFFIDQIEIENDLKWFYIENNFYSYFVCNLVYMVFDNLGVSCRNIKNGVFELAKKDMENEYLNVFTEDNFLKWIGIICNGVEYQCDENKGYSVIDRKSLYEIYLNIGYVRFKEIISLEFKRPNSNSRGWPDLLGVSDEKISFVEIKNRDNLTVGQIENFPRINKMGLDLKVVVVS